MKIAIGSDPNAFALKSELLDELDSLGHEVKDFGSDDPVYANVATAVGESVARRDFERGIVLCGTGIGASIAANKVPGVYCALVTDAYQAERAILSNNANVIAIGALVTGPQLARMLVRTYLANFYQPGGRSEPKIARIVEYEKNHTTGV